MEFIVLIAPPIQMRLDLPLTSSWTDDQRAFLREHYPTKGKMWCARELGKTEGSIRSQANLMHLKQDRKSKFKDEWQARAALSKVGKKRPDQAVLMRKLHEDGKFPMSDQTRAKIGEATRKRIANVGHPRGALGMKHSDAAKEKMSAASILAWSTKSEAEKEAWKKKQMQTRARNGTVAPNHVRGSWKAGWREIGGQRIYARSRWEANYARFLEFLRGRGEIKKWEHEPETFWFDGIARGVVSYLPDFRVTLPDDSHDFREVKGWWDDRSRTKIKRMRLYYPNVKLLVIDGTAYKQLARSIGKIIADWE